MFEVVLAGIIVVIAVVILEIPLVTVVIPVAIVIDVAIEVITVVILVAAVVIIVILIMGELNSKTIILMVAKSSFPKLTTVKVGTNRTFIHHPSYIHSPT